MTRSKQPGDQASPKVKASRAERLQALRDALEEYQPGTSELFDATLEHHKSAVRHRALLLLNQRPRSRAELRDRLRRLEFDIEIIDRVLDDLERVDLIDDAAFARQWVVERHARRGKSKAMLDAELSAKGVSDAERREALGAIDDADEQAMAAKLAAKKARSMTEVPEGYEEYAKMLRRVLGVLARRGFPGDVSRAAAEHALAQRIAELGGESPGGPS